MAGGSLRDDVEGLDELKYAIDTAVSRFLNIREEPHLENILCMLEIMSMESQENKFV